MTKRFLTFLLSLLLCVPFLTACKDSAEAVESTSPDPSSTLTSTADESTSPDPSPTLTSTADEAASSEILGTWEGTENEITYTYTFEKGGKGVNTVSYSGATAPYNFSWEINGDTLSFTFYETVYSHTQDFGFELNKETLTLRYMENTLILTKKQ